MTDNNLPELSKAEYQIMKVLWKKGELSIREVHECLRNDWAISTSKTVIERLHKKGLLQRRNSHGINVYASAISRPAGLARWIGFIADHVLEMDPQIVVSMFHKNEKITDEELGELTQLVDELKKK